MLQNFTMKYNFNKLAVRVHVDCIGNMRMNIKPSADVTVIYDGRIVAIMGVPFEGARTPELVDAWARKPMGERGNMIEYLEWMARNRAIEIA